VVAANDIENPGTTFPGAASIYMAVEKGCDVDKPRNLAKSVTVE
jgi:hypothetical protein